MSLESFPLLPAAVQYLDATSSVQGQFNAGTSAMSLLAPMAGATMTGVLNIPLYTLPREISTPTVGTTVTIGNSFSVHLLNPAGTLATLSVIFPSAPVDLQVVKLCTSQVITALTLGAGAGTIVGALTALALGGFGEYQYRSSNTTWYRVG